MTSEQNGAAELVEKMIDLEVALRNLKQALYEIGYADSHTGAQELRKLARRALRQHDYPGRK